MENFSHDTVGLEHPQNWAFSLRTRLILSYVLVTFVAILGMGYYIYVRALQSNALVSKQLDASVIQQSQANLTLDSAEQANNLDKFFNSISNDMTTAGTTAANLLSNEGTPNTGVNWDAAKSLSRSANGSWDNSNSDIASVFIPAKMELTDPLIL